jgi:uncharacterized tellurite resistance protein B-like protein
MAFWKWLGPDKAESAGADVDSLDAIEKVFRGGNRPRARYAAAFTYILTRSARADHQITEVETREMARIVAEQCGVDAGQAAEAVTLAAIHAKRSGGTDDFVITREFDTLATHEQKVALVNALFTVSAVDASIVTIEDNEIRRIANELRIEHSEYIAVRSTHLDNLAVLRTRKSE